jgi:hypothetical protein
MLTALAELSLLLATELHVLKEPLSLKDGNKTALFMISRRMKAYWAKVALKAGCRCFFFFWVVSNWTN